MVTLGDASREKLPASPNAHVERFVSHREVLEKAAAVVCHGGMGIVQKSLASAVPVVAVPFGRDQPEIGRRLLEAGLGQVVPKRNLSANRLRHAVRMAIADRPAALAASRAVRETSSAGRFADLSESLSPAPSPVPTLAP